MKIVILLLITKILQFGAVHCNVSILQGNQYISAGQDRFLTCELGQIYEEEVQKIEWTKDGNKIEYRGRISIDEFELAISKIEQSDEGSYQCHVTVGDRTFSSSPVTFSIFETIKFENCESWKLFEKGSLLEELHCHVNSTPVARLSWYNQGKVIKSKNTKFEAEKETLKIKNIDLTDSGLYSLVAKQSRMGIKKTFVFNVTVYDPVKIETNGSRVDVKEGEGTSMHCKASGVPAPTYSFLNGTDKISKLDDNEKFSVEFKNGGAILHIKEAEVAYMGDVICKAHNEYSHQDTTFFLNVLETPRIQSFENVTSQENDKLEITCNVRANPPVFIEIGKVSKEDNKEIDKFKQRSSTETNSFTFNYHESSLLFEGYYYCKTISNNDLKFPDDRATTFVEVLYKPLIEAEKNIKEVKTWANNLVELVCVVKANPKPSITWKTVDYNGVEVNKDFGNNHDANINASQHLSGYSSESENNYYRSYIRVIPRSNDLIERDLVCTASNSQGLVTETFQVLEAFVPGAPEIVGIEDLTATSFVVVVGEFDDGGTPVLAYEATYYEEENRIGTEKTVNFTAAKDKKLKIDNLSQKTSYIVAVRAINGVGAGEAGETNATTKDRAVPTKVILLESRNVCQQKNDLQVMWQEPYSSGLPIEHYEVFYKIKEGKIASGANKINISEWMRRTTKDTYIHLRDLEQSSEYEVFVLAQNIVGLSKEKHIQSFHTCKGEHVVLYVGAVKPFYGTHTGSSYCLNSIISLIFLCILSSFILW